MTEELVFDVSTVDLSQCVGEPDKIRAVNPHRYEFELLSSIVMVDLNRKLIVGYKDLSDHEFWARGHFPGGPLMPGVLMLEAAAQLCNYYVVSQKIVDEGALMGLGGIDEARFYRPVRPGDRLVLVGHGLRLKRRINKFRVTGYVNAERAFETIVLGVPIGRQEELNGA